MLLRGSNLQPQICVLPVAKGLDMCAYSFSSKNFEVPCDSKNVKYEEYTFWKEFVVLQIHAFNCRLF